MFFRPNSYIHKNDQIFKLQGHTFLILLLVIGSVIPYVFLPQVYAYVDPGTGSAIIYILISTLVGIGMTFKIYWNRIKEKLTSR